MLIFFCLDCSIIVFSLIFERSKKMLLCGFNEIHCCHAAYCMIKMIKTTNNEKFEEFVLLKLNRFCNSLFLINIQETFVNPIKVFELNKTILLPCFNLQCAVPFATTVLYFLTKTSPTSHCIAKK